MKRLLCIVILIFLAACTDDSSTQPKEICHYEDACADTYNGGFRDRHSGCKLPYQKQVCEEIHY